MNEFIHTKRTSLGRFFGMGVLAFNAFTGSVFICSFIVLLLFPPYCFNELYGKGLAKIFGGE